MALNLQAGGHWFESSRAHLIIKELRLLLVVALFHLHTICIKQPSKINDLALTPPNYPGFD